MSRILREIKILKYIIEQEWIQHAIEKGEAHEILGVPEGEEIYKSISVSAAADKVASRLGFPEAIWWANARRNAVYSAGGSAEAKSWWDRLVEELRRRYGTK